MPVMDQKKEDRPRGNELDCSALNTHFGLGTSIIMHHSFHFSKTFSSRLIDCIFSSFSLSLSPFLFLSPYCPTMNPDNNLVTSSNTVLSPRRKPSSSTTHTRQSDIPNNSHQRVVSISSVSSRGSSAFASPRYPSGITTLTSLSSDPPSTCISRSSSTSVNYAYQHHHQQYDTNPISEDQFDIINNLDYDDVDDGLIGAYLIQMQHLFSTLTVFTS